MSLNTGSGMRVISDGSSLVRVLQARPGRPLMTMAQDPQIPARQQKSNWSDVSCSSRMRVRAIKRVMLSVSSRMKVSVCGTESGSIGL